MPRPYTGPPATLADDIRAGLDIRAICLACVAQCYAGAGRTIPPGAAAILVGDTEEALDRDTAAFEVWCMAHGVECVRVLGISDFR